ncbi:MAG: SMC-Scp complex subunit ScpB [Planctomycetaceae bacterium]|jgi:segregation and condensation protein B|nr:SMC-Scp complex subunit ScpB [Planctomycetaceae bacterium]
MSGKKTGKKILVPINNTDSSDNSSNSGDTNITENTDININKNSHNKISDQVTEMCRKLGAKYYEEDIGDNNEEEKIFSLNSLREVFLQIKSGKIEHNSNNEIKITDYIKPQNNNIEIEYNNYDSINEYNKNLKSNNTSDNTSDNISDNTSADNTSDKTTTEKFIVKIDGEYNDNNSENEEPEQEEILDTNNNGTNNDIKIPISPESIFEAMLFVGDRNNKPLTTELAAGKMRNVQQYEIDEAVNSLNKKYDLLGTPYEIIKDADGYRMILRKEFSSIQEKFYGKIREAKLSQSAIDVLAIIAYKQPITADEIQTLRKLPSSAVISQLVKRGLIRFEKDIQNKKKKILYKTTQRFLELFQLNSIDELPIAEDFDFR